MFGRRKIVLPAPVGKIFVAAAASGEVSRKIKDSGRSKTSADPVAAVAVIGNRLFRVVAAAVAAEDSISLGTVAVSSKEVQRLYLLPQIL